MATHSSILAWEIPWIEEVGCSPCGHNRVRQDLVTKQQRRIPSTNNLGIYIRLRLMQQDEILLGNHF